MTYQIISDSTCDLSPEQVKKYNIHLMPLYVQLGDKTYRDGVDIHPDDIYAHVAAGGDLAATAAADLAAYVQVFSEYSRKADFVIHVTISSDFSCCYQNACLAAADYDNVYVVDSRNLSTGHGLVVLEAVRLAESGMEPKKIVETLNELTARVRASFILDRLDYMKKGGRCSAVAALGANMLKLKPCIEVKDGKMGVCKKYRGSPEHAFAQYVQERLEGRTDIRPELAFITHPAAEPSVVQAAKDAAARYGAFDEVIETNAGCTVSCHCGPHTLGILFIRK